MLKKMVMIKQAVDYAYANRPGCARIRNFCSNCRHDALLDALTLATMVAMK